MENQFQENSSKNVFFWVLAAIVAVAIFAGAAYYYYSSQAQKKKTVPGPTAQESVVLSPAAVPGEEVSSIEQELNAVDLGGLDSELNDIDKEL